MKFTVRCYVVVSPFEEQMIGRNKGDFVISCVYDKPFNGNVLPRKGELIPIVLNSDPADHEVIAVKYETHGSWSDILHPVVIVGNTWHVDLKDDESPQEWADRVKKECQTDDIGHDLIKEHFTFMEEECVRALPSIDLISWKPPVSIEEIE